MKTWSFSDSTVYQSPSKVSIILDKFSKPEIWIMLYFAANLILTIHNKWVLSKLNFRFPWILTALHIGMSGTGSYFFQAYFLRVQPTRLGFTAHLKLLLFSVLYAVNIAISNVSLAYVSLAFHQLIRSSTPAFTLALERFIYRQSRSARVYFSLVPVVLGVCLATVDEFSDVTFTLFGLFLTLFGVILSSAKGVVTNAMMVGSIKLHPLELIWRMSPPSVIQCLIYAAYFGEVQEVGGFFCSNSDITGKVSVNYSAALKLFINGTLAMLLNFVSFTANKKTSALAMTVAGNIKQALSIIIAIYIFDTRVSVLNLIGAAVALAGGAWYSYESYHEQLQSKGKSHEYMPVTNRPIPI